MRLVAGPSASNRWLHDVYTFFCILCALPCSTSLHMRVRLTTRVHHVTRCVNSNAVPYFSEEVPLLSGHGQFFFMPTLTALTPPGGGKIPMHVAHGTQNISETALCYFGAAIHL